jgi:hypothetical protein
MMDAKAPALNAPIELFLLTHDGRAARKRERLLSRSGRA